MHIYRIDHQKSWTHSWLVTIQCRGRIYNRQFSDGVHGGKQQALEAAKTYRDNLRSTLQPWTRQELCSVKKKNNRSGVSGVTRIKVSQKIRGRTLSLHFWLAQWPIGGSKAKQKKFSIKKYGERGAFLRALAVRRHALKTLWQPTPTKRD